MRKLVLVVVFLLVGLVFPLAVRVVVGAEDGPKTFYYTVREGDTLWKIASLYHVDVETLKAMNGIGEDGLIFAGQTIRIPDEEKIVYTIKEGETLWRIARHFGVTVEDIVRENDIQDVTRVAAGRELVIPRPLSVRTALVSRGLSLNFSWPLKGAITSFFGPRNGRMHEGIDVAADTGTPILAAQAGRVTFAGPMGTYGNAVVLDHGRGVSTLYAHANKVLVTAGQEVAKGEPVAEVGSTGRSSGPHLHFEVRVDGRAVNPLPLLREE